MKNESAPKDPYHYRWPPPWAMAARIAIAVIAMFVIFSAAYILSRWALTRVGLHVSLYIQEMITVGTGFCLVGLTGALFGHLGANRQRSLWQAIIDATMDAMAQIARGNFETRIDPGLVPASVGPHPFLELVTSLNTMAEGLSELEVMRQEFVANVSHEIQSPLSAITGFAQILQNTAEVSDHARDYLHIIYAESQRLSGLTENLLHLTALESGAHPVRKQSFWVDRQIRDTIVALEPLWAAKDLGIEVDLPALSVVSDRDLMNQVWVNLITNAIKFTHPSGTLTISGQSDVARGTCISVSDTGIGIALDDYARIFERFYKADPSRTQNRSGSGLGLAIVQKIVALHGGTISVQSVLGEGTTFTVTLPPIQN